jgi:hypothetical protein
MPTPAAIPPTPTPVPPLQLWPLPADLFYLTETGQVWRQPAGGDEAAVQAVTPDDLNVREFAVAPGGGWLLIRTDDVVALAPAAGTQAGMQRQIVAQQVGLPVEGGRGHSLAWSRDAARIAFATADGFQVLIPGAGDNLEPLVYAVGEGPAVDLSWSPDGAWLLVQRADSGSALYAVDPLVKWVELGRLNGYAWLGDGRLAFAPAEGGLALLLPGDLNSRVFVVPQDRQVTLPVQRADGTLAFFAHSSDISQPGFLHTANPQDLSFRVESPVPIYTTGLAWDATGLRLAGIDPADSTRAVLLDPQSGAHASLEAAGPLLRLAWGDAPLPTATGLPLPADLYFLAPQGGVMQVWRLPADGSPPQAITAAPAGVAAFDVSQGGAQIVYTSSGALWLSMSGAQPAQLAALSDPALPGWPVFSPDGAQIAYTDGGLWLLDLPSGEARRVASDRLPLTADDRLVRVYEQPQWSPDGTWLLARVRFYEGWDSALVSVGETGSAPLLLDALNAEAVWGSDGSVYVHYAGGPYGSPYLDRVRPGDPPARTRLAAIPVLDVALRDDGRIAVLRTPPSGTGGPSSVRVFSLLPDGSGLLAESAAYILEQAALSPGAGWIAGLAQVQADALGLPAGRLAVVDVASRQIVLIEGVDGARDLRWGR